MATSTDVATALTKNKHLILIAALGAAGTFVGNLVNLGVIGAPLGAAVGSIIGELLIYEHSA